MPSEDDEWHDSADVGDEDPTVSCPACGAMIFEDTPCCPACGDYLTEGAFAARRPAWIVATVIVCLAVVAWWVVAR